MRKLLLISSICALSFITLITTANSQRGVTTSAQSTGTPDKIANNLQSQHDLLGLIPTQVSIPDPDRKTVTPYSGKHWNVHPLHVGNLFSDEIDKDQVNDAGPFRYRNSVRSMTLSIFNPSLETPVRVQVDCGDDALVDTLKLNRKELAKNSFWSVTVSPRQGERGGANCRVNANRPITVTAIAVDTIRQNDADEYGGIVIHQSAVAWPAYRPPTTPQ